MKDKNTIIIIDIVLVTVAIALAIFLVVLGSNNNNENNTNDTVNTNEEQSININDINYVKEEVSANIDDGIMSEYSNDKLGFKLKYYNDLTRKSEVVEDTSMYKSAAMYKEEGNEGINVLIGNIQEETTLENYMYATLDAIVSSNDIKLSDIEVIKENVKLGGVDAFKVRYKMDDINIYQIVALKDKKEYVVTYSAEDKYYDKQKGDNMFTSFEFISK